MKLSILIAALFQTAAVLALQGDSDCGEYVCVNATVHGTSVKYQLTPRYADNSPGWMALGFGKHMRFSPMIIMWSNADGSTTVSQRLATAYREPQFVSNPPRVATIEAPTTYSWQPPNVPTFAFSVPVNTSSMSEEHLIWAFGLTRPSSASPDADLEMHFAADTLVFDLTKELDADGNHLTAAPKPVATTKVAPTPVPTMRIEPPVPTHTSHEHVTPFSVHEKLIVLHAGFLVMGFLVLLPFGSLVARWTRTFTTHWFKAHKLSNYYVSAAFIVLGWSLGPIAIFKVDAAHLNDSHKIGGVFLFALYLFQLFLGRYIHARKSLPRKWLHPPSNIFHAVVGLAIIGLAFLQVRSGLSEWKRATGRRDISPEYLTYLKTWAIVFLGAYGLGLLLLRRQFRQERSSASLASAKNAVYTALNDGSSPVRQYSMDHVEMYGANPEAFAIGNGSNESLPEMAQREHDVEPLLKR